MKRHEEEQLRADLERDASVDDAWEESSTPAAKRRSLGAQVSVRLSPEYAERLRRIAGARGLGYTSLLREWIEHRIQREDVSVRYSISQSGHTTAGQQSTITSESPRVRGELVKV